MVHVEHGIGKYMGLVHKRLGSEVTTAGPSPKFAPIGLMAAGDRDGSGLTVDLLVVEYAGGDKLYLPVYRLNQIQKFQGSEGAPKLDRLGGQTFAKTKARVAKQLKQMADELLLSLIHI